jgi:hypothetical protein
MYPTYVLFDIKEHFSVFNPPVGPHVMLGYSNNPKANLETFDKVSKELANFLTSKCFIE